MSYQVPGKTYPFNSSLPLPLYVDFGLLTLGLFHCLTGFGDIEFLSCGQDCPDDPGQFIGQSHGHFATVFARLELLQPLA